MKVLECEYKQFRDECLLQRQRQRSVYEEEVSVAETALISLISESFSEEGETGIGSSTKGSLRRASVNVSSGRCESVQ